MTLIQTNTRGRKTLALGSVLAMYLAAAKAWFQVIRICPRGSRPQRGLTLFRAVTALPRKWLYSVGGGGQLALECFDAEPRTMNRFLELLRDITAGAGPQAVLAAAGQVRTEFLDACPY